MASGTLRLNDAGTLVMELVMQCASPLPPGTGCEVEGDGRRTHQGHYSIPDRFVQVDGRHFPAGFYEDRVRITIQIPQKHGHWARLRRGVRR